MTMDDVSKLVAPIRARVKDANQGPWHWEQFDERSDDVEHAVVVATQKELPNLIAKFPAIVNTAYLSDAILVANAPQDLNALCDALESVAKERDYLAAGAEFFADAQRQLAAVAKERDAALEGLTIARDGLKRADVHLARDKQYADKEQRKAAISTIAETLAALDDVSKLVSRWRGDAHDINTTAGELMADLRQAVVALESLIVERDALQSDAEQWAENAGAMQDERDALKDQLDALESVTKERDEALFMKKGAEHNEGCALADASSLAATQCHGGYGDDHGNWRCNYQDQLAAVAKERDAAAEALKEIDDFKPSIDDWNPYQRIANYSKKTARAALEKLNANK